MEGNECRREHDFLGTKEIPNHTYYGVQTVRALENFPITGNTIDPHLIVALAIVKKSAAQANRDIGHLDEEISEAIIQAAQEIIDGDMHDQFIVDPVQGGAGTSSNMNANEVIANRALEILGEDKGNYAKISPTTHVNMAQSTNDVFPTANHIAILTMLEKLVQEMGELYDTYKQKAEEFYPLLKMARTHLQDAVPIRLGQEFEAYACALKRDIERIQDAKKYLYPVNMGGTAVGTGLNADPQYIEKVISYLRENSGLPIEGAENLVDATQNTDAYTGLSAALKIGMLNLSKVANDLRLMASGPKVGFNELELPARQPGSSIMPGKVNPVMAEVVNQVAFQVSGNDHTVCLASEAGQFELNVMEPVLVYHLIDSIKVMTNVVKVFREYCVTGIKAHVEQLEENMNKSLGIITAINPHVGYERATEIAQEAFETGESIRDICERRRILTKEELDQILDASEMTKPGISANELLTKH
ncbi:MAG TPA: aspartate ammonia-lyase [Pseudogracilibacillus sp.]|nr:aspartate ammonia-lyase [Pseudogracilibacillus sp.]